MRWQRPPSTTSCELIFVSAPCVLTVCSRDLTLQEPSFPAGEAALVPVKRVQVTVVDGTGRRFPIRGMEGQTLVEVLESHEGPLDVSECECCSPTSGCIAHSQPTRHCTAHVCRATPLRKRAASHRVIATTAGGPPVACRHVPEAGRAG